MSEAGDRERDAAVPEQGAGEAVRASVEDKASDAPQAGAQDEAFDDELGGEIDEVDLREIMRSVLDKPPESGPPDILNGVQKKLRVRSRGKFYADGWSTAPTPRSTYLVTSLFMLALIALVFLVLIPWGSGALKFP